MRKCSLINFAVLWIITFLGTGSGLWADETVQLSIGESKVISVNSPQKVAVGDSKIADVQVLSEKEILLSAKGAGVTNLIVWNSEGKKETTEITVVTSSLEKVMVEIDVQVLEINRSQVQDLGIDWPTVIQGSGLNSAGIPSTPLAIQEQSNPPLFNWGTFQRGNVTALLDALVTKGYAKVLAKPKLLAVSGTQASFLAGGEVPIVNQDSQGHTSVTWKQYGVTLDIEPNADTLGNVNALVRAEVSNLDSANAVRLPNGTYMPAIRTRWAKTNVFVKKGGTLIMAGLIQEQEIYNTVGVPILSEIPLLGELFKTHHVEHPETELVIFVTPSIVGQKS